MLLNRTGKIAVAAMATTLATATAIAWACGPFFPNRLLVMGDSALLWAPVADFAREIALIDSASSQPFRSILPAEDQTVVDQTAEKDSADLAAALAALPLSNDRRAAIAATHGAIRARLKAHAAGLLNVEGHSPASRPNAEISIDISDDLPSEFRFYLRGALAFRNGDLAAARAAWHNVLALPAEQRRYRSTWAEFMIGKSYLIDNPAEAIPAFARVRTLAQDGFHDSLGLAAASLGWEAYAHMQRDDLIRAAELYLDQHATGDPGAVWSLRLTAAKILDAGPGVQRRAVSNSRVARIVTAYLIARGGPPQSRPPSSAEVDAKIRAWLDSAKSATVRDLPGAERLAWAAYQIGRFDAASSWLDVAHDESAIAHWLRAKLLLRAGRVDEAAKHLATASAAFPPDESWDYLNLEEEQGGHIEDQSLSPARRAMAELGTLRLGRRQYVEALDALLRSRFWLDAAYVAEQVLSVDELVAYVRRNWPALGADVEREYFATLEYPEEKPGEPPAEHERRVKEYDIRLEAQWNLHERLGPAQRIRSLLARRLVRLGRLQAAREFLPRHFHAYLDEYARNLEMGRDRRQTKEVRAESLMKAARIARHHGLELIATELEPDWACLDGNFELSQAADDRSGSPGRLNRASADELARARRHGVKPARRWHYRYLAADLAWEAAELLPDASQRTAEVLCEGGSWLKAKDPKAADRFYKAIVRRCGNTPLGQEAARLKWFPPNK